MTAFARITAEHDRILSDLTPCAGKLYRWLLRSKPAGKTQEVLLEEFQTLTDYSLKWIKSALNELVERELVEIIRRYSARIFKLICFHPEKKTSADLQETSPKRQKTSQEQGSNPHPPVPSYREILEKQAEPTQPPVEDKQGSVHSTNELALQESEETYADQKNEDENPNPKHPAIAPEYQELLDQAEQAGVRLAPPIIRLVTEAGLAMVKNAIALLLKNKEQGKVKNPTGFFYQALKHRWKAREEQAIAGSEQSRASQSENRSAPAGFKAWFDLAQAVGLVKAATMREGIQFVYTNLETMEEWEQFRKLFPLEKLQEMQGYR